MKRSGFLGLTNKALTSFPGLAAQVARAAATLYFATHVPSRMNSRGLDLAVTHDGLVGELLARVVRCWAVQSLTTPNVRKEIGPRPSLPGRNAETFLFYPAR
jgi:hypothetical protein